MTQSTPKPVKHSGRIFTQIQWTEEEVKKYQAEKEAFYQRCRTIFEKISPNLIQEHYGWYIAIEPHSGDYFIDPDKEIASQKAHQKYPDAIHCMFCLNTTGATGKI
ncbi:conserved hypothetical protein [Gloeothece citriformis PCC 7424]|uniref:DUF5678 domain-containing protein n=1 Tax=Gloeothece citriformis (strain PCC 7424) TaxID=65393 RepID=B7KLG0_GLOC7|nr:hypothetical protein [Gloeothece citriformis]ACK72532.1 conserved hypothetical protein [Gloeothece citriformis PCC 7424]